MLIYWNKRKHVHEKRVQLPEDFLGTPTWPPFHCFGTPIWPPWRHVKTLYSIAPTSGTYRKSHASHNPLICSLKTFFRGSFTVILTMFNRHIDWAAKGLIALWVFNPGILTVEREAHGFAYTECIVGMSIKSTKGAGDGLGLGEEERDCGKVIQLVFRGCGMNFRPLLLKQRKKRNRKASKTWQLHLIILPNFCF